jgi:hypothetical protein
MNGLQSLKLPATEGTATECVNGDVEITNARRRDGGRFSATDPGGPDEIKITIKAEDRATLAELLMHENQTH